MPARLTSAAAQAARAAAEHLQLQMLYVQLQRLGLFDAPLVQPLGAAIERWRASRGIRPLYTRWVDQSLSLLRAADLLADTPAGLAPGARAPVDAAAVEAAWEEWCEGCRQDVEQAGQAARLILLPQADDLGVDRLFGLLLHHDGGADIEEAEQRERRHPEQGQIDQGEAEG